MSGLVFGWDFTPEGAATALTEADAATVAPGPGAAWRWLHYDVAELAADPPEGLPEIALETLTQPETRPRTARFPEGLAVNLRGVNLNPDQRAEDMVSLRVWVSDALVVTARLRRVMTVETIRQRCEAGHGPRDRGALLALVAEGLMDRAEAVSLELEDQAARWEDRMLDPDDAWAEADAAGLTALRRAVAMLRRFATPQRAALDQLVALGGKLFDQDEMIDLTETANRAQRQAEALNALQERLQIVHEQITAAHAEWMGRHGYILSVVAAIFLPLGFITGLFGVNVGGMPGVEWGGAFWALSLGMVVLSVAVAAFFRWRRWF